MQNIFKKRPYSKYLSTHLIIYLQILNSEAYRYIQKQGGTIHTKQMTEQGNNQFKELSSIKFIYHPLKKFMASLNVKVK